MVLILQYAVEIYSKFNNDSTTFVRETAYADNNLTMPPITICMDNGLKPTVLNRYGIFNIFDFMTDQFVFQDTNYSSFSVWNTFVEASYLIGRGNCI